MAKWILIDDGLRTEFKSPRELGEYLRTMDETELIEDEAELTIIVED